MELKVHKKNKNGTELLKAEPFQPFKGDCYGCKYFMTNPIMSPSGKCRLHDFFCGFGFTCKDYESLK